MPWTAQERSSHLQFHIHVSSILTRLSCGKTLGRGAQFSVLSLLPFFWVVPSSPRPEEGVDKAPPPKGGTSTPKEHEEERKCRDRFPPSHKHVSQRTMRHHMSSTQEFTVLRHKNWSCKYMEDMYCDSDYNNVILFTVINTFYTCQGDVETKTTVVCLCV